MAASDSNAILPVRIGTAIAIIATVVLGFTEPIFPSDVTQGSSLGSSLGSSQSSPGTNVWWFGVALVTSVSGIIGLFFLHRRANRLGLNR